jgi:hypothetical protein
LLLGLVGFGLAACRTYPVYEYQLDETILADAPVRAAGQGVRSAGYVELLP